MQITREVRVQNIIEHDRDSMQGINTNESEIGSQYFVEDLSNVEKSSLDSKSETIPNFHTHSRAGQDHSEESKVSILKSNFSTSNPWINMMEKFINYFGKF